MLNLQRNKKKIRKPKKMILILKMKNLLKIWKKMMRRNNDLEKRR
jgi:hypothetical protein